MPNDQSNSEMMIHTPLSPHEPLSSITASIGIVGIAITVFMFIGRDANALLAPAICEDLGRADESREGAKGEEVGGKVHGGYEVVEILR